jgi:hypothetical protein
MRLEVLQIAACHKPDFVALQDIHVNACDFWARLGFGLRIRNSALPQDEYVLTKPDLTN